MIKFIDLDGVIIDSIHECFSISLQAFYGEKNFKKYEETKNLFLIIVLMIKVNGKLESQVILRVMKNLKISFR